ncbi:MAG: FHA domain-containing protein [Acidimicrobiia bacterium]|nr:FHA domain-containing protein [Acidimicrobiia bacterium]
MRESQRRYTIGREISCDIPVADDSVSRLHAQLTIVGPNRFLLTDCNSSNGTTVIRNGVPQPVREEIVTAADVVRFGGVTLPMQEMLALLQEKHGIPESEIFPSRRLDPAPAPLPEPAHGRSLERCQCGSIKVKGETCLVCRA